MYRHRMLRKPACACLQTASCKFMYRIIRILFFLSFINLSAQNNCLEKLFIGVDYNLSTKKLYKNFQSDSSFRIISTYTAFKKSGDPIVIKSKRLINPYDKSDSLFINLGSSTDGTNPEKIQKLRTFSVIAYFKTQTDRDSFRQFIKSQLCKDLKIGNQSAKDKDNNVTATTEDIYLLSKTWYPNVLFCDLEESNKWTIEIIYQDLK